MVDWTFKDTFTAIQSQPSILASILQSADGLCLGDIRFAKIQTTLQMCTVPITVLEKWIEGGSFNPEHLPEGDYSHTIGVKAAKTGDGDGPASSPCTSHSPVMHTSQSPAPCESHSPTLHTSRSPTPCVHLALLSLYSPLKSPSPTCHSQSSRLSSSSSGSSSGSGSVSGSGSLGSLESGSGDESGTDSSAGSQAPSDGSGSSSSCSTLPEVVLVQGDDEDAAADEEDEGHSDDEETLSQGTVSLLHISNSDNEEAHKATAHKKACKSDVQFTA